MTSPIIKNSFENIYKDDYADSDHYHRILFNSGRHVQARELTQSQTLLQKEIERFARNIFKEGAAVSPAGNIFVDNRYSFVKLQGISSITSDVVGNTFTGSTSGVMGTVLRVVNAEGADPTTLYIAYSSGGGSGATNVRFAAGETISDGTNSYTVQATNTTDNPATGYGTLVSVGSGEFFVVGHFVFYAGGNILLSKYTTTATEDVGFTITEDIVTATDNIALYDNSTDIYNTTAPGADRYRIRLSLALRSEVDSAGTFVYVGKIVNGALVATNDGRSEYNKILDLIAERTYEESGNYTVKAPYAEFSKYIDSGDNLSLRVSNSLSYVRGYRLELPATSIDVAKSTTTETVNNEAVAVNYGNYIEVSDLKGIPNLSQLEKLNLIDDSDYASGSVIGTARIRGIETTGANYRFHLFDIKMGGANSFRDTRAIGTSATKNAKIVLSRSNAYLEDVINNDVLFPLPMWRPSSISDVSLTVQRIFTGTTDTSGELNLNLTAPGEDFSSISDWVVSVDSSGEIISPTITGTTTTSTSITSAPSSSALTIFGFVQKGGSSGSYRTKTLTTSTVTEAIESDGSGLLFVDLAEVDIYGIDSARDTNSVGPDIRSKFRLDTGQRDNYYDHGRLILNSNETSPSGNVYVKFRHFTHGGTGNFFCVNSYDGQVEYKDIPTYRQNNGEIVSLSDVLDFRSSINDAGTEYTGTGGRINELPQSTELVTLDASYYLSRKDKLVLDPNDGLVYIKGDPAINPKYPPTPEDTMSVYRFTLNPNTLNNEDLRTEFVNNRRYTMRDIGRIDKKIEDVREVVALSLLDLEASTFEVLDENGLTRTKSGFLTDDFRDHRASDVDNEEYRAAIDPERRLLSPSYRTKNVGLIFDSAQSTSAVLKGDKIMLGYTEEVYLEQTEASRTQNVNPFEYINFEGTIELSPSSDEWVDEVTNQIIIENDRTTARTSTPNISSMDAVTDHRRGTVQTEWGWWTN